MSKEKVDKFNIHIFRDRAGSWGMSVQVDGVIVNHERCGRGYAVPGDAITSARHLVNEVVKEKGVK